MSRTKRILIPLLAFAAFSAVAGGCAQKGRTVVGTWDLPISDRVRPSTLAGETGALFVRATDAGFDDPVTIKGEPDQETIEPPRNLQSGASADTVVEPAFPDDVRIALPPGTSPFWWPGRGTSDEGGRVDKTREDTDLGRSRAQRRGEGGGPTRSEEGKDEETGEDFKSSLLVRALGLEGSTYNVFGWLQGSFTGNPSRPRNGQNFGVNPNTLTNTWLFQQFFIALEKPLDPAKSDGYDFGFRLDNLFGSDWTQYHMVGLLDDFDRSKYFGWEPIQFYGEIHLPWLTRGGVDVKGGRFFSLGGYEDALAPGRPLNSGSYLFGYAQPFTHFGFMTTWHASDRLNVFNGTVNGWDRWIDRNYRWGYAGGLVYDFDDDRTNATLTLNLGPNQFPSFFPANYPFTPSGVTNPPFLAGRKNLLYGRDNALLLTGTLIHEPTDDLTLVIESDYGSESNVPNGGTGGIPIRAQWYGVAGWSLYALSERLTGVYRSEVFRDDGGVRTGFNDTYFEMTLGLIVKPRSWFWLRPEVRFDWADGAPPYDGGTRSRQFTLGFDTIFLF